VLEASAFQALQAQAPYRGIIKPPVELVVHDYKCGWSNKRLAEYFGVTDRTIRNRLNQLKGAGGKK